MALYVEKEYLILSPTLMIFTKMSSLYADQDADFRIPSYVCYSCCYYSFLKSKNVHELFDRTVGFLHRGHSKIFKRFFACEVFAISEQFHDILTQP